MILETAVRREAISDDCHDVEESVALHDPDLLLNAGRRPHHRRNKIRIWTTLKTTCAISLYRVPSIPRRIATQKPFSMIRKTARGKKKEKIKARSNSKKEHHGKHNDHVVHKDNDVFPDHPENMDAKRHGDLLDNTFSAGKNGGAIGDQRGDQSPENHSYREKGQIGMDILMEQLRIEKSHGQNGYPQTQGDPERPE